MNHLPEESLPRVALSVKQPWAELIVTGRKTIEVRSWTNEYRGMLFIHTGKRPASQWMPIFPELVTSFRGGLLGFVRLVEIIRFTNASWSRLRPLHLVPGPKPENAFGWVLEDAKRLASPMPFKGQLGLFLIPEQVAIDVLAEHE